MMKITLAVAAAAVVLTTACPPRHVGLGWLSWMRGHFWLS